MWCGDCRGSLKKKGRSWLEVVMRILAKTAGQIEAQELKRREQLTDVEILKGGLE